MFHKGSDCLLAVPAFGRIDDIIRLNQDLIVNAVDLRRAMVVPYQIGHTVDLFSVMPVSAKNSRTSGAPSCS